MTEPTIDGEPSAQEKAKVKQVTEAFVAVYLILPAPARKAISHSVYIVVVLGVLSLFGGVGRAVDSKNGYTGLQWFAGSATKALLDPVFAEHDTAMARLFAANMGERDHALKQATLDTAKKLFEPKKGKTVGTWVGKSTTPPPPAQLVSNGYKATAQ